ncbi:MAG: hypothetical protein ACRD3Q_15035 [Terriglobales bacterium]
MKLNIKLLTRGALAVAAGSTLVGGMSAAPASANTSSPTGHFTSANSPIQALADRGSQVYGYPGQAGEEREIICATTGGDTVDQNVTPGENAQYYSTWYRITASESPTGTGYVPLANFVPDGDPTLIPSC